MPVITDFTRHREQIADLNDRFAIKNFVLADPSGIRAAQSFEEPFIFDGFVFGLCLKGQAAFKVNYQAFEVSGESLFTFLPGQIFKLEQKSDDLIIETLFVSADFLHRLPMPKDFDLLKKIALQSVQPVTKPQLQNILELHALISKYHRSEETPYRDLQVKALVFALLMEIAKTYTGSALPGIPTRSRQEELTDRFFRLLVEHATRERTVVFYAGKLCLTPKYLSMAVKKVTGHPILEWINEAVIIESKKRLKATDDTVLQISEELNFPTPSYFGRFFKQYTGLTPLEYRNS